MIALFCLSVLLDQLAISERDRPQPMHQRPVSSSWQMFTQGDAIMSVIDSQQS
jgi:hypothetical protein